EALCGLALATSVACDSEAALDILRPEVLNNTDLGTAAETARIQFLEIAVERGILNDEVREVATELGTRSQDPRLSVPREAVLASVRHALGECDVDCGAAARKTISEWSERGARFQAISGSLLVGPLLLAHHRKGAFEEISEALRTAHDIGVLTSLWPRLRRLAPWLHRLSKVGGSELLEYLIDADSEFWVPHAVSPELAGLY